MTLLSAVPYRKFIEVLYLLEVCIPVLPSEAGRSFMIFQNAGSGYMPKPSGCRCPFMSKDNDELVPSFEVGKTLRLLEIPISRFIAMLEGCQAMSDTYGSSQPLKKE